MTRCIPLVLMLLIALPACGGDDTPASTATKPAPKGTLLTSDLPDAVGIKAARKMEAGVEVAVFGRVQELNRDGYAIFYLVDDTVDYCGRGAESCGCLTPWDYCCEEPAMLEARMPIELRGADGLPVKDAELGLRLLDLVAVHGTLEKTEEGGLLLVVKDGWFRRDRPTLPDGLEWPSGS